MTDRHSEPENTTGAKDDRHYTDKTKERPIEESSERLNKDVTDPTVAPIGERGIVAPKPYA